MAILRRICKNVLKNIGNGGNRRLMSTRAECGKVTVNGVDLFFERHGDSPRTLLCIPGALGTTQSDFAPQLKHLSKEFTLVAFDPRGYGKSQPPLRDFPEDFFQRDADDAAELMLKLGFSKYSVLGWSDGGIVGLILTGKQQEAVEKLVVFGSNAFVTELDIEMIGKTRDLEKWSARMKAPLEAVYGKEGLHTIWNNWMDRFFSFADRPQGDICISSLANILCPTLIIHGMKDALVPESHANFLYDNIKNSKLYIMPDGKHNLHLRYYEEFNNVVSEFLNEPT